MTVPKFVTEKEAAELLRVSCGLLRKWRNEGGGPRYVRMGRAIRYPYPGLVEFVESVTTAGGGR